MKGKFVKFAQKHLGRVLTFIGKVHDVEKIDTITILHVEVAFSDGTLWALVKEEDATICAEPNKRNFNK